MKTKSASRANDPTYQPTKNFRQLAKELPGNKFLQLLAAQENGISTHRLPDDDAEAGTTQGAGE